MFNERYYTCSVTKTPIKPGDPVMGVFLAEVAPKIPPYGPSDPTEVWTPFLAPIKGEFDPEQIIVNVDRDWNFDYILDCFRKYLIELDEPIGCECCYIFDESKQIDYTDITWNDVTELLSQGALQFITDRVVNVIDKTTGAVIGQRLMTVPTAVHLGLVHQHAWDTIIEQKIKDEYGDEYNINSLIDDATHRFKDKDFPVGELSFSEKLHLFGCDLIMQLTSSPLPLLEGYFRDVKGIEQKQIFSYLAELTIVNLFMNATRNMWQPQNGFNSGAGDNEMHKLLHSLSEKIIYRNT